MTETTASKTSTTYYLTFTATVCRPLSRLLFPPLRGSDLPLVALHSLHPQRLQNSQQQLAKRVLWPNLTILPRILKRQRQGQHAVVIKQASKRLAGLANQPSQPEVLAF